MYVFYLESAKKKNKNEFQSIKKKRIELYINLKLAEKTNTKQSWK